MIDNIAGEGGGAAEGGGKGSGIQGGGGGNCEHGIFLSDPIHSDTLRTFV